MRSQDRVGNDLIVWGGCPHLPAMRNRAFSCPVELSRVDGLSEVEEVSAGLNFRQKAPPCPSKNRRDKDGAPSIQLTSDLD
jgi:hypothetical protein